MRVLIIDNYDSYTYNLCQLVGIVDGGQLPVVVRHDDATVLASITTCEQGPSPFDAIIVSPGPGRPECVNDFGFCCKVIECFSLHQTPILGVCLGHQGIVHAFGGRVVHAQRPVHGEVAIVEKTEQRSSQKALFSGLPSTRFRAVRYHSLVAETASLPSCLEPLAWCTDVDTQERILMAVRHQKFPIFGVQFHIESAGTEYGDQILRNFLRIAQRYRLERGYPVERIAPRVPHSTDPGNAGRFQAVYEEVMGKLHRPQRCVQMHRLEAKRVCAQPAQAFLRLYGNDPNRQVFWLDSCYEYRQERWPAVRWSMIGEWESSHALDGSRFPFWEALDKELSTSAASWPEQETSDELPPFIGGYLGYLGFELKRESFDAPHGGQSGRRNPADAFLGWVHRLAIFDHQTGSVLLVTNDAASADPSDAAMWIERVECALTTPDSAPNRVDLQVSDRIRNQETPRNAPCDLSSNAPQKIIQFEWSRSRDQYLKDIRTCLEYIRNGESYEICLTNLLRLRPTKLPPKFHPLTHYLVLRRVNAAPFAAYLQLGPDIVICSASPERFLLLRNGTMLESRPIKGTIQRSADPAEDARLAFQLSTSRKDRAENLMIVDLVRNDFGRLCKPGTVQVPQLMRLETFASVHQLVSIVQGRLPSPMRNTGPHNTWAAPLGRVLRACFPMGSMTGAPKQRTLEILEALEKRPRGIYSGSIGYVSANGQHADWNVIIRTAVWERRRNANGVDAPEGSWGVSIGVGGAIVAHSDPQDEYEETLLKARSVIESIREALQAESVEIVEAFPCEAGPCPAP
jgi:para-aminobenzoate synthetase